METTSFFFTNIPPESTTVELWKRFGQFGRVGEVYIPNRLDKQGRRFGFVKFRDVRDATELLRAISDIWVGSFKLRVNKARFRRDEEKREPDQAQPVVRKEVNVAPPAHCKQGCSFKEALTQQVGKEGPPVVVAQKTEKGEDLKIVWEMEVEEDLVAVLKGAFVGFLNEDIEVKVIQQYFSLNGFHNLKVITMGHRKVLLSSVVEEEVKEIVSTVGGWSKWFDRFVPWSPASVSKYREVWLSCYGVPLFAWGESLFKALAYKHGTFITVDDATKHLMRVDVARIKVSTSNEKFIDSSLKIMVLGQKFVIKVLEVTGRAREGEAVCCGGC
jgi:hypothetical protein